MIQSLLRGGFFRNGWLCSYLIIYYFIVVTNRQVYIPVNTSYSMKKEVNTLEKLGEVIREGRPEKVLYGPGNEKKGAMALV